MQDLASSPFLILVVIGVVAFVSIIIVLLWKSGWSLRNIKKLKIGPVEGERFDERKAETSVDKQPANGINVQIRNSRFEGNVGDIGGIIIKQHGKKREEGTRGLE